MGPSSSPNHTIWKTSDCRLQLSVSTNHKMGNSSDCLTSLPGPTARRDAGPRREPCQSGRSSFSLTMALHPNPEWERKGVCLHAQACTTGGEGRRKGISNCPGRNNYGFAAGKMLSGRTEPQFHLRGKSFTLGCAPCHFLGNFTQKCLFERVLFQL